MLPHSLWWLAVDALAVYRLAVLLTQDTITARLRGRFIERGPQAIANLVTCQWCVSIWFAIGAVALTRYWPEGWQYAAMALAFSGVAGFMGER